MFDVLPRSLFNGGNGGIQLSYPYDTALSLTICNGVQNHLAPKTLHSYFTLVKLLYASSIHTRSSSPHVTDHVSQLAQEDFVSEQKSQAVMHAMSYSRITVRCRRNRVSTARNWRCMREQGVPEKYLKYYMKRQSGGLRKWRKSHRKSRNGD